MATFSDERLISYSRARSGRVEMWSEMVFAGAPERSDTVSHRQFISEWSVSEEKELAIGSPERMASLFANPSFAFDSTDSRLLRSVLEAPRAGVREFSRRLGVASEAAEARLGKLEARGLLATWAPTLEPTALGYPFSALDHIYMAQTELEKTCAGLAEVRGALEAMSVVGEFAIVCVLTRDYAHLEEVFISILSTPGVLRTRTEVILRQRVGLRMAQLLDE